MNRPDLNKPQQPPVSYRPPGNPEPSFAAWVKAHKGLSAGAAAIAVLLFIGAVTSRGDSTVVTPVSAPVPSASKAGPVGNVPDLRGKGLPSAETLLRTAGFTAVTAHDSSNAGRMQFNDPNWKVCFQDPAPGQYPVSTPVDLGVVQRAEACPAVDGTAVTAVPTG